MRLSVNELETLARKAAVGAGVHYGYAAESAAALIELRARGIDAVPGFARALKHRADGRTGTLVTQTDARTCTLRAPGALPACALYAAPAARDFTGVMITTRRFDRVDIRGVDLPSLVVGRLSGSPPIEGLTIRCFEPGGAPRWTVVLPPGTDDEALLYQGDIGDTRTGDLSLAPGAAAATQCMESAAPDVTRLFDEGVLVDPSSHEALKHFFELTLVPDSEESRRHGAGAGLVDSD